MVRPIAVEVYHRSPSSISRKRYSTCTLSCQAVLHDPVMAVTGLQQLHICSLQPTGNVLAMADEAGGVALWRDAIPEDELDVAALRAAPSPVGADADMADDPAAHGDSLEHSLGEPGVPARLRCQVSVAEQALLASANMQIRAQHAAAGPFDPEDRLS